MINDCGSYGIQKLNDFLDENDCKKEFWVNLKPDQFEFTEETILGAFTWENTLSGHDYWSKINDLWCQRFRQMGLENDSWVITDELS